MVTPLASHPRFQLADDGCRVFLAQYQALILGHAVEGALGIKDHVDPAHRFEGKRRLGDVRQHEELAPCVNRPGLPEAGLFEFYAAIGIASS